MENIAGFALEDYFAKYEFSAKYLLSCSDCSSLTLPELLSLADSETLSLYTNLSLGYTETTGHPLLRKEIASLYKHVSPSEIIVLAPEEGIFIFMSTIVKTGDRVLSLFPAYQSLYQIAKTKGCEIDYWLPRSSKSKSQSESEEEKELEDKETDCNGWWFSLEDFYANLKEDTKVLIVNFPHNPTGAVLKEDEWKEVLDVCKERDILVFSDEIYRFLEYDSKSRLTSACENESKSVVVLAGLSKGFGLPGLRMGWLVVKDELIFQKIHAFRHYTTICSSAPSEILALIALRAKEKILERSLNIILPNLDILDEFFKEFEDLFEWKRPNAGPITLVKTKFKIKASEFCNDLVESKGVMIVPSNIFDYGDSHFRIGFGRENLKECLEKLREYLNENKAKLI
jgi:aspartate/methionine/tyrosine aminotransferase